MRIAGWRALGGPEERVTRREARFALATAGGLYFVGALLCASAALLPHVGAPAGVIAVALEALLVAGLLLLAARRGLGRAGARIRGRPLGCPRDRSAVRLQRRRAEPVRPDLLLRDRPRCGLSAAWTVRTRSSSLRSSRSSRRSSTKRVSRRRSERSPAWGSCSRCSRVWSSATRSAACASQRRRMEILIAATARLDRSLDPAETLRTIAHMAVPELAELCVIDLLGESGADREHGRRRSRPVGRTPGWSACARPFRSI